MINSFSNIFLIALSILSFAACNRNSEEKRDISAIIDNDSIPLSVKKLVKAVADGDSTEFAKLVSYPLSRPYPLPDLNSPKELESYYPKMMDDSLKSVITASTGESWDEYGWRGWSLDRGEYVWIDDNVYDIPYLSKTERHMLDSLRHSEIESLHPSLRNGWQPVGTLITDDNSAVFRIDLSKTENNHPVYRLCNYETGTNLSEVPTAIFTGYKETEGTAATEVYHFSNENGISIIYEPNVPDGSMPQLEITKPDGSTHFQPVRPAYWLNLPR